MTSELCIQGRLLMKNQSYQLVEGVAVGLPHKGRYLLLEIDTMTRIDHAGACGSFQKKTGNDQWNSTNPLKSVYATPCPPLPPCSPLTRHTLGLTQDLETGPEKMLWDGDTLLALSPLPKALVCFALHSVPCLQGVRTASKSLDTFKCFREQISTCCGCLHAVLLFVLFGGQLVVAAIPMRRRMSLVTRVTIQLSGLERWLHN